MKSHLLTFTALFTLGLLLVNVTAVSAVPPIPSSFYGTVKDGSRNVASGTPITARINGVEYAWTTAMIDNGDSVYTINVPGDDPDTPELDGGIQGDTITFYVDGMEALQTAEWQSATNNQLNLIVSDPNLDRTYVPLVLHPG
jgi:hypothetical protein